MLDERTIDIMEENDIRVYNREQQNGEFWREIEFYSPEGEDVIKTVWYDGTNNGFVEAFTRLAEEFDTDAHAEMWIPCRGKYGAPNSIRALLDDAEAIKKKLLDVAKQLKDKKKS